MKQHPPTEHPKFRNEEQAAVAQHPGEGMQRMKADAAAVRVVDRRSQEMVDVDDEPREKLCVHRSPPPSQPGDREDEERRHQEVERDVHGEGVRRGQRAPQARIPGDRPVPAPAGPLSRVVHASGERGTDLAAHWARRRGRAFRRPLHAPTADAFRQVDAAIGRRPAPILLDAGCGTGESTEHWARRYPEHWILGIDRSAHRLAKATARGTATPDRGPRPGQPWFIRADLGDWYRLAAAAGWRLDRHFVLYPNPYPKAGQRNRRWPWSPVFPAMLALGGHLTLRTNWRTYAEEWAEALGRLTGRWARVRPCTKDAPVTRFEAKYARNQTLYEVEREGPLAPRPELLLDFPVPLAGGTR